MKKRTYKGSNGQIAIATAESYELEEVLRAVVDFPENARECNFEPWERDFLHTLRHSLTEQRGMTAVECRVLHHILRRD